MKLFVGLGNPGARYAGSRHNVGFRIVAALAERCGAARAKDRFRGLYAEAPLPGRPEETVGFLLPGTFMNASGSAVLSAVEAFDELDPTRDLLVAYDDLDLALGRLRLRASGGAGGHNGVSSLVDSLGTRDFARLRFGLGRPPFGSDVTGFVLGRFTAEEESLLAEPIARACDAAETLFRDGVVVAMDRFNRNPDPPEPL